MGPGLETGHAAAIVHDLSQLRAAQIRLRPNPLQASSWPESPDEPERGVHRLDRRAHVIDLSDMSPDTPIGNKRLRRSVRQAERAGVEVEVHTAGTGLALLDELTALAEARWAAQQGEPLRLTRLRGRRRRASVQLAGAARALRSNFRLYVAWLDGRPVAATLTLLGHNAHATRTAIDPDRGRSCNAGHILDHASIRDALELGCRSFHLGESGDSSGLAHYKETLGGVPVDYREVRIERLPITPIDRHLRKTVKRIIGFRDAQ